MDEGRKAHIKERRKVVMREKLERNQRIKCERGCMDCGNDRIRDLCDDDGRLPVEHARQLHWDHRPGVEKFANISDMISTFNCSWTKIEAEMEKCDVVCALCHQLRTDARERGTHVVTSTSGDR